MGNDPAGATICLMDFDGFPEIKLVIALSNADSNALVF